MNATTRPSPAPSTAVSSPVTKPPRRRPEPAPAPEPRVILTMDPKEYPKLDRALREMRSLIYLAQAGVELIDPDEPTGLEFITKGLEGHLRQIEELLDNADTAALAIAPRASAEDARSLVVKTLVAQGGFQVPEADMPALTRAYAAESAEAETAGENLSCGVMLDRAMRRMKAEAA